MGSKPIVVVNKVDKQNCRPHGVQEMVFELMFNLNATEEQLDFPTIFGSAKQNRMSTDWRKPADNISVLLDTIIEHIPAPEYIDGPSQMLITSLDFSSYAGPYRRRSHTSGRIARRTRYRSLQNATVRR